MGRGGARAEPGDEAAAGEDPGEDPEGDECGFAGLNEEALRLNRMLQGGRRVPAAEAVSDLAPSTWVIKLNVTSTVVFFACLEY